MTLSVVPLHAGGAFAKHIETGKLLSQESTNHTQWIFHT